MGMAVSCGGRAVIGAVVVMTEAKMVAGMVGGMVVVGAAVVGTMVTEEALNQTWSLIPGCWG